MQILDLLCVVCWLSWCRRDAQRSSGRCGEFLAHAPDVRVIDKFSTAYRRQATHNFRVNNLHVTLTTFNLFEDRPDERCHIRLARFALTPDALWHGASAG